MFKDILHEQLGAWPLGYIPYGGADVGEVAHIADQVGEGGDDAFYSAWTAAADRLVQEAEAALLRKHEAGARECLLRAAGFYAKAWHPLSGASAKPSNGACNWVPNRRGNCRFPSIPSRCRPG